mmetsp:Transcript_37816/g.85287  ORF Transcript_37816/g.85287 Transcript_37816/m.85287 type:complete len:223 (+) Transcript_37816:362-1030(+)
MRCCSPSERTEAQSLVLCRSCTSAMWPRFTSCSACSSMVGVTSVLISRGYSSCCCNVPWNMYGRCGMKNMAWLSQRRMPPLPSDQRPAMQRSIELLPMPLSPTMSSDCPLVSARETSSTRVCWEQPSCSGVLRQTWFISSSACPTPACSSIEMYSVQAPKIFDACLASSFVMASSSAPSRLRCIAKPEITWSFCMMIVRAVRMEAKANCTCETTPNSTSPRM